MSKKIKKINIDNHNKIIYNIKLEKGVCRLCGYLSRPGKRVFFMPENDLIFIV